MVAFVGSFLVALVGMGIVLLYGRRRPVGATLSWGEAIAAATYAFGLMFWAYGVVPNQWLQFANNELVWTSAKILVKSGQFAPFGQELPPFTMSYETLSHLIVVGIYGFFLTCHIAMFALWQDRQKRAEKKAQLALEPSTYGRPLVREGA